MWKKQMKHTDVSFHTIKCLLLLWENVNRLSWRCLQYFVPTYASTKHIILLASVNLYYPFKQIHSVSRSLNILLLKKLLKEGWSISKIYHFWKIIERRMVNIQNIPFLKKDVLPVFDKYFGDISKRNLHEICSVSINIFL